MSNEYIYTPYLIFFAPLHSGPESPKMDKTIYSLNKYILYMFIGVFWVKESVFEVFRTLGAVMTPQVVIQWWWQGVKTRLKPCDMYIYRFFGSRNPFEVFSSLGAVMTTQVVIKWWSQVVIEGQDKVKAMICLFIGFLGQGIHLRFLDL